MIFGIDVSRHQGWIDWTKVSGVSFAICRASLATTPDPTYKRNIAGARARGLVPGAYHFLYPSSWVSARRQADLFISQIGNPEGLLTVLDVERDGDAEPDEHDVAAFVARWREVHPTHPLIIYTGRWYWTGGAYPIRNARGSHFGPLWLSRYVDPVSTNLRTLFAQVPPSWWIAGFGGWTSVTLLQFSSSASITGIRGRVDVNAFRGDIGDLRLLTRSLPDTTAEDPMVNFTIPDTATIGRMVVDSHPDHDHSYLLIEDGTLHEVGDGFTKTLAFGPVLIEEGTVLGDAIERRTGYLTGLKPAFFLATDVEFTAYDDLTPYDKADLEAAAATAADAARAEVMADLEAAQAEALAVTLELAAAKDAWKTLMGLGE